MESKIEIEEKMIDKQQLLIDIENTEKELKAYRLLLDGFGILANLPENAGDKSYLYSSKERTYSSLETECAEFLNKLKKLKAEG